MQKKLTLLILIYTIGMLLCYCSQAYAKNIEEVNSAYANSRIINNTSNSRTQVHTGTITVTATVPEKPKCKKINNKLTDCTDYVAVAKKIDEQFNNNNNKLINRRNNRSYTVDVPDNDVINYIREQSIKYGQNPDKNIKIARCENDTFDETRKNPSPISSATGIYQFVRKSWNYYGQKCWSEDFKNKNIKNYKDNVDLAICVINMNGYTDWEASKHCWG